jgi:hypothetical protein
LWNHSNTAGDTRPTRRQGDYHGDRPGVGSRPP